MNTPTHPGTFQLPLQVLIEGANPELIRCPCTRPLDKCVQVNLRELSYTWQKIQKKTLSRHRGPGPLAAWIGYRSDKQ